MMKDHLSHNVDKPPAALDSFAPPPLKVHRKVEKEYKNAFYENEHRLQMLLSSIPDIFIGVNDKKQIILWNPQALKTKKITKVEINFTKFYEIFPEFTSAEFDTALDSVILKGKKEIVEINLDTGWQETYYEIKITPSPDGASLFIKETTKNKLAEKKLVSAKQEIQNFLYKSSHNLKGPVASLAGLYQLMKIENTQTDPYLEMIKKTNDKLSLTIESLEHLALISAENIELNEINFESLVYQNWKKLKQTHHLNDINFVLDIQQEFEFYSDEKLINEIFYQILDNTIRFRQHGKPLHVTVTIKEEKLGYHFSIEDNGLGIPKDHINKVCHMFHRASEQSKSIGVGLYMTKKITELLQGAMRIESLETCGTKVSIYLPHFRNVNS